MLKPSLPFRLHVPRRRLVRERPALLVMLHGCQQDSATFAAGTRMNELADRHGFVVLYPEQSRDANSFGCWNWFDAPTLDGSGEAAALVAVVRGAIEELRVDRERVYVAGMSAGGAMAAVLAACHGTLFAACAIHSSVMYRAATSVSTAVGAMRRGSATAPAEAARYAVRASAERFAFVPTIVIHGDRDDTVHPVNAEQIAEQAAALAGHAETSPRPHTSSRERRLRTRGRAYRMQDFGRRRRLIARKIIVEGLGHAWSGGDGRHPFNDPHGPASSQLIWDFVRGFRRPHGAKLARRLPALLRWMRV